ncbi:hypothetical protein PFAG_01974 [Plasmodium falciparum Santa Lucia]|uniref:Uncharacterized protein n=7 Tax=Plasmodium falciparum TaxID=5833 RepID=W7K6M8_PLAFO|nr:hypothetical protein PFFVO_02016 [Plasmodium falciparum Vietnam Oak-Knoll (FVO)]ETW43601.1 hypothetical protein PFNF135_02138 [Plasmodium falciparum NF135/5.C10]ETW49953.1 hypothetical protein PFMALIP_02034 [Plasmodium falciparum MaliPS096_E11]ETW62194.1 hypothetical protein PFMC_01984 [Plasmodium falciparum CAMP/Malaysia]EUR73188.1 hypothetical protein PFBG_02050 [Plasmodium falciparum 7G8]EUT87650.1 hypothetical protein PFAG_01974 [Plasmodium falciparum Santa Lucia]EWC89124.1 hypothetica
MNNNMKNNILSTNISMENSMDEPNYTINNVLNFDYSGHILDEI